MLAWPAVTVAPRHDGRPATRQIESPARGRDVAPTPRSWIRSRPGACPSASAGSAHLGTPEHLGTDLVRVPTMSCGRYRLAQHVPAPVPATSTGWYSPDDEQLEGLQVIGSAGFVATSPRADAADHGVDIGNPVRVDPIASFRG